MHITIHKENGSNHNGRTLSLSISLSPYPLSPIPYTPIPYRLVE